MVSIKKSFFLRPNHYWLVTIIIFCFGFSSFAQSKKINWMTFAEAIEAQKKVPKKILMDVYTTWCGPCKMVAPILEQIASERDITIAKVNTDQNRNTPGRFGVRGIPTLVLFNEGQVADQRTGAASKPNLDSWLDQHMS